jgi:hypothetical protein
MSVARGVAHVEAEPSGASFVWPDAASPAAWERARYPHSTDDVRAIEDIALPELTAAIRSCSGAEDALSDAARRFGIRRVSAAARTRLACAKPMEGHHRE